MKAWAQFIGSTVVFIPWAIAFVVSWIFVPVMLKTKWDGKTTWFGNFKYGRGDTHYKTPSNGEYWKQLYFLCWRNPVSNFGKGRLAVKDRPWVWLHDPKIVGQIHFKFGWKTPSGELPGIRTFVYRPWLRREP